MVDAFLDSKKLVGILIGFMPGVLLGLSLISSIRYRACILVGFLKSPCHEFCPGENAELIWEQGGVLILMDG